MSTRTFSSVVPAQNSTANFRTFGSEFSSNLQLVNPSILQLVADSGNINWTTVNIPGGNTFAGYEIYQLNDSLFSSAPIYVKVEYGVTFSLNNTPIPKFRVTIGTTWTNGGTLGGVVSSQLISGDNQSGAGSGANGNNGIAYTSYMCCRDGYFGWISKAGFPVNFSSASISTFIFCRTTNSSGAFTTNGYSVIFSGNNVTTVTTIKAWEHSVKTAAPSSIGTITQALAVVPGSVAASIAAGNLQVYTHWLHYPTVAPSIGSCTYIIAEISSFSTFSATLFGSTAHTYMATGLSCGQGDATGSNSYGIAMIWE